jgi:phosphocarrier protein
MQTIQIKIINKLGLHARAAAKLVHLASRYGSEIKIIKGQQEVNAKSIMGVMMLGASCGTDLDLHISGDDELDALNSLVALIQNRFGESE